jgi:hypothetical protein
VLAAHRIYDHDRITCYRSPRLKCLHATLSKFLLYRRGGSTFLVIFFGLVAIRFRLIIWLGSCCLKPPRVPDRVSHEKEGKSP